MNNLVNNQYTNEAMMFEAYDEDDFLPFIDVVSDDDDFLTNNTIDTIRNFEHSIIMISDESDDDSVIFISSNLNDASTKFNGWDDNVDLLNKSESDVIDISPAEYYDYNINYDLSNPNDDDVIPIDR
jgi:hypothetical protein